jgi:cell volume regulation protein A
MSLVQFHDGIAWLFQIAVFLALGLLVFPSQLLGAIGTGTMVALFMIFVARPISVFAALPFGRISKRAKLFVAWAGLRGAFPIILGTFPILANIPSGHTIFNVVFFVVLFSVLVQGTTLRYVGRMLGVATTRAVEDLQPAQHSELLEVVLSPDSPSAGKQVIDLGLPRTALIVLLRRDSLAYIPRGGTVLKAGDQLLVATRREDHEELRTRIEGEAS